MLTERQKQEIESVFDRVIVNDFKGRDIHFEIESPAIINLRHLLTLCLILGCEPEQLYWSADLDYKDCYYPGDRPELTTVFEVRSKESGDAK